MTRRGRLITRKPGGDRRPAAGGLWRAGEVR